MFSTFDCAVKGYRQKEDAWNAIISGFMTGGCLAARSESLFLLPAMFISEVDAFINGWAPNQNFQFYMPSAFDVSLTLHSSGGPKAAFGSAVACGILLGVFEGVGVLLGRVFSEGTRPQLPPCEFFLFHSCGAPLTQVLLST
jgi:import inner membrane translocase subunit TIM17